MKKRVIPRILSFVVAATMLVPLWSPVTVSYTHLTLPTSDLV